MFLWIILLYLGNGTEHGLKNVKAYLQHSKEKKIMALFKQKFHYLGGTM